MPVPVHTAKFEFLQVRSPWRLLPDVHPQYRCEALLDPYLGCALGCRYCPALTEESLLSSDSAQVRVGVKTNVAHLLSREIRQRKTPLSVVIGALMEPYQNVEERFFLTRQCLELLTAASYPVHVLTKSKGVIRDIDLLALHSQRGLGAVTVSVTTLKNSLAERLEPHAPSPAARLDLLKLLSQRGVIAGVSLAPVMPRLTDKLSVLKDVVREASDHGAAYVLATAFSPRLAFPHLFLSWLKDEQPDIHPFYEKLFQGSMDGYDEWRRQIWMQLTELCDEYHVSLYMPVDSAPRFDALPAELWGE